MYHAACEQTLAEAIAKSREVKGKALLKDVLKYLQDITQQATC